MSVSDFLKRSEKIVTDNSPAILTAIGVVGTLSTAYFAGSASWDAALVLDYEKEARDISGAEPMTTREQVQWVLPMYVPTVISGVTTVAAIVAANQIGNRRAAAMAAAYTLSEKALTEYREKARERMGEAKERKMHDEIVQEKVTASSTREVIIAGANNVLCYDKLTDRYFQSNMEEIRKAENKLNNKINNNYYASLGDFYSMIGLAGTSMGEELGWNSDKLMELEFSTVLGENGVPCLAIDFRVVPIRQYHRVQ